MPMKLIGYWMESLQDTHLPLPQELVGQMPESVKQTVCNYLTSGKPFEAYRGFSWCRFHCGTEDVATGSREFTDGEWVWPEGLVHYVQAHDIVLPEDFIASARRGQFPVRAEDDTVSLDFWVNWTAKRRRPSIRASLAAALASARAAEPALIESLVEEVRQRETEGTEPCMVAACSRPALAGRRICARHMLTEPEIEFRTAHLYQLPHRYDG